MNTLNTITARTGRMTLAINKLELLNQDEGRPILSYLIKHVHVSLVDIILHTGMDTSVVENYLEKLLQNGFVWKEQSDTRIIYTLDQSYFQKITLVAKTLAGFWT